MGGFGLLLFLSAYGMVNRCSCYLAVSLRLAALTSGRCRRGIVT
jgi:hypothetical protein